MASGPLTATFMLRWRWAPAAPLGGNVMTDAFGLVALVAMMPLITVQAMGAIYVVKSRRSEQTAPPRPSATMTSSNSGRWPEMELYCIISITDRSKAQIMQDLYASCGLHMIFTHLGVGTARSEHLSLYGLEATDKAVVTGVASASEERQPSRQPSAACLSTSRQRRHALHPAQERRGRQDAGLSQRQERYRRNPGYDVCT